MDIFNNPESPSAVAEQLLIALKHCLNDGIEARNTITETIGSDAAEELLRIWVTYGTPILANLPETYPPAPAATIRLLGYFAKYGNIPECTISGIRHTQQLLYDRTETAFDYSKDLGPSDDAHIKCTRCGYERIYDRTISYQLQSDCPTCNTQMMGWDWNGWKSNAARTQRQNEQKAAQKEAARLHAIEAATPEFQNSEPFTDFTEAERTIANGLLTIHEAGTKAPWMSHLGACLVTVYGIRRKGGLVQFGIGNEKPPILHWVTADQFYNEWPD